MTMRKVEMSLVTEAPTLFVHEIFACLDVAEFSLDLLVFDFVLLFIPLINLLLGLNMPQTTAVEVTTRTLV